VTVYPVRHPRACEGFRPANERLHPDADRNLDVVRRGAAPDQQHVMQRHRLPAPGHGHDPEAAQPLPTVGTQAGTGVHPVQHDRERRPG
jgi:hypothetical protein